MSKMFKRGDIVKFHDVHNTQWQQTCRGYGFSPFSVFPVAKVVPENSQVVPSWWKYGDMVTLDGMNYETFGSSNLVLVKTGNLPSYTDQELYEERLIHNDPSNDVLRVRR